MIFGRFTMARRGDGPPPDLAAALAELTSLSEARPELSAPAAILRAILSAAFGTAEAAPEGGLAAGPPLSGTPIFRSVPPPLASRILAARARAIADAVKGEVPAAGGVSDAIRRGTVDVAAWARAMLDGRADTIGGAGFDTDFARSLTRLTLLPTLARITASDQSRGDRKPSGGCPWCGEAPILAEMRGLEREVRLRCGLCAGDWPGGRLWCPGCGETDHRRLETFHVEGEADRCRLLACRSCGYRLKLVATFGVLTAPSLLVADLATVHLDLIDVPG